MGFLRRQNDSQPPRRPLPPPGVIRRQRRALERVREERLRDLGGLMLEMYRRDHFREDLIEERCAELAGIDKRLGELETLLRAAQGRVALARCECGATLSIGVHFCPNCGRPAGEEPVVACPSCGYPLSAGAAFCTSCGAAAEETPEPAEEQAGW